MKIMIIVNLFIIYMTKLLQSDWLRGVQLMIYMMAGGGGGGAKKSNMGGKFIFYNEFKLTEFWHKNEFKNIVWQKDPVENTWKQF